MFHLKLKKKLSNSWFVRNNKLIFLIVVAATMFLFCFFQLKNITKLTIEEKIKAAEEAKKTPDKKKK